MQALEDAKQQAKARSAPGPPGGDVQLPTNICGSVQAPSALPPHYTCMQAPRAHEACRGSADHSGPGSSPRAAAGGAVAAAAGAGAGGSDAYPNPSQPEPARASDVVVGLSSAAHAGGGSLRGGPSASITLPLAPRCAPAAPSPGPAVLQ